VGDDVFALAAQTSEGLRANREFEQALALCEACGRRTPELRIEEAIAAFACARDDRVREIADLDANVARSVAPWLAATQGKRVAPPTSGSSPGRTATVECCRAVSALVAGNKNAAKAAQTALNRVPVEARARFFVSELLAASRVLAHAPARSLAADAVLLAKSSAVRRCTRTTSALAMAVARRAPEAFLDHLAHDMGLSADVKGEAGVYATCATGGTEPEQARVSMLIAKVGASAFPEPDRGSAALYEGFAFAMSDPARARRALDEAVAWGGDITEAMRGKLVLARTVKRATPDALREKATAAHRVQQHLERDPLAGPLVALAVLDRADAMAAMGKHAEAVEMLRRARDQAKAKGFLGERLATTLDEVEAHACFELDPNRSRELIAALLARDPKHHDAWHLRVEMARRDGYAKVADDLVLEAAKLGVCRDFAEDARSIRAARGESVALVPGIVTAGELAEEVRVRLRRTPACDDRGVELAACRRALEPGARAAFDAAHVAILGVVGQFDRAIDLVADRIREAELDANSLGQVVAPLVVLLEPKPLREAVDRWANAGASPELLEGIFWLVLGSREPAVAEGVWMRISHRLRASQVRALQNGLSVARVGDLPETAVDPRTLLSRADRSLQPAFSIMDLMEDLP
jgi:hypothetical protein